jgi:hypothetical protein
MDRWRFAGGSGRAVGEVFVFLLVVSTKLDFISRPTRLNKVRSFDLRSFSPGGSGGSASLPSRRRFRASIGTVCCCCRCFCSWRASFLKSGELALPYWPNPTGDVRRVLGLPYFFVGCAWES